VTAAFVRPATEPDLFHAHVGGRAGEHRPQLSAHGDAEISGLVVASTEAGARACARVRLSVAKDNAAALALYGSRGYERVGESFSAGLRSRGVVIHAPEPVWDMVKRIA
jgi:hypothetical protein